MKTTLMFRPIANPRRTTLAHLKDATELGAPLIQADTGSAAADGAGQPLPQQTANPRRTVLNELPTA